jgi:hypothetical protein
MVTIPPKRPDLATRSKIWDLAIKLGRELGARIVPDPESASGPMPAVRRVSSRRIDYG